MIASTSGFQNTAVGVSALRNNTTGSGNVAVGQDACNNNQTASGNTGIGYQVLMNNSAADNTALGSQALVNNSSGINNTATGASALFSNTIGAYNTATGSEALTNNINGESNTGTGASALSSNTNGANNTANGASALFHNTTGKDNTATGVNALALNQTGANNTSDGFQALLHNTGSNNAAVGFNAGANLTTGGNNIDIGANVPGVAGEANTIRIGKQGTQKSSFIAGIFGTPVTGSTVVVSSSGKLGVATSSARFKKEIKPMDQASEAILALKPVTFRYKEEIDPEKVPQFGLIAEEVEKVNPDLVARDEEGKVYTVRYEAVNVMLLNEFLKEHRMVEEQKAGLADVKSTVAKQEAIIAQQQKDIEALTATMQKVSERFEMNSAAPQLVADNQ
jgi:hypothetical protein